MAKLKKSAGKTTTGSTRKRRSDKPRTGLNPKSITESAQQIWLAGMGAFNRAQSEGSKLFETLVRDGLSLEQTARKFAGQRANVVRDAVEGHVGQARERAADTWDKLEKVFEDRVQRALVKLGVPGRDDLNALTERVERLTDALRKSGTSVAAARKPSARAKPAAPTPAKPARKAVGKKAAKTSAKTASKAATPVNARKPAKPAKAAKSARSTAPASGGDTNG